MEKQSQAQVGLLQKIAYLFDRKQLWQLSGLAVLILIGGILETLGVSMMLPVAEAVMAPDKVMENELVGRITALLGITSPRQLIVWMLGALIAIFIFKNAYLLFLTFVQNTFVTRNRNRMISRVMREFLNRPYEDYLGADIPTVFRLTDSDIPNAFQLVLVLIQMTTEIVVAVSICIVLLVWVSPLISIGCGVLFLGMTLVITRVLKPRLNAIGRKNQSIQSRIAKWRIQSIYGLKDVKVLHREEFFVRNYYESGAIGANVARNYAVMNNTPRLLIETVFIAAMLSFIVVYMLEDGDIIDLGGRRLEVLHTPGHSPGHMCFFERERGYLFTGDLVYKDVLLAYYPSTDPAAYLASMERVAALPVSRVFPGHHSLDIQPEILVRIRDAFRALEARGLLHHGGGQFDYGDFGIWI